MEPFNLIYIDDVGYTKEELRVMVNYYKKYVLPSNIPGLNDDTLGEIMIHTTPDTLKSLCLTNKQAYKICLGSEFWQYKFTYDQLPQLVVVRTHKDKKGLRFIDT